jgi:hypothetical protein
MQVSFGQFIPVSVHCNQVTMGPRKKMQTSPYVQLGANDKARINEITDDFALKLSRREEGQISELSEQQRRVFKANVSDYSLPSNKNISQEPGKTSAVVALTIGDNRYLVTGAKDVQYVESNLLKQINPPMFEKDVVNYISKNHALSDKKIDIYASEMPLDSQDKYRINLIDFYSAISSKPITGRCAQ